MIALSFNIDEDSAAALIADAIQKPMSVIVTGDQLAMFHILGKRGNAQSRLRWIDPESIENIKPALRDLRCTPSEPGR